MANMITCGLALCYYPCACMVDNDRQTVIEHYEVAVSSPCVPVLNKNGLFYLWQIINTNLTVVLHNYLTSGQNCHHRYIAKLPTCHVTIVIPEIPGQNCRTSLLSTTATQLSLCSSSEELLTVSHCKTMLGRRRFLVAVPRVWNSLPLALKTNCDSLRGFKTVLKTYLFHQNYN